MFVLSRILSIVGSALDSMLARFCFSIHRPGTAEAQALGEPFLMPTPTRHALNQLGKDLTHSFG